MKRFRCILLILVLSSLIAFSSASAQVYYFQLPQETVNVFWNEDGTESLDYLFTFHNDPSAGPIEYVDLSLPNRYFDVNSIHADVNGNAITDISESGYQGTGPNPVGVALGLGSYSIQPGSTGQVHAFVGTIERVLYEDSNDSNYASADFSPAYFDSSVVYGKTDLTVIFHLPPGVKPDEPRWHASPSGWPASPVTGLDDNGRITYTWHNADADGSTQYLFGASFPLSYVPASAIVRVSFWDQIGTALAVITPCLVPGAFIAFFVLFIVLSMRADRRRKLAYMPPKIAIEGHGIKRGLTAIEAAVLIEEGVDKIMTMILFAVIKKNAARVTSNDPLEIEKIQPTPTDLQAYEVDFLAAFDKPKGASRRKALQDMMISLVKSVSQKMKGFSRRETIAYYRDIIQKAWAQVEAADTPEVKSEKYDEVMEWTMLDRDYDRRTREVFQGGPVFVPIWWPRYDPGFGRSMPTASGTPISTSPGRVGTGASLPHLPGSDFAASMVKGVQTVSAGVLGNITDFTNGITRVTNPPPPPSTSSGRSSGGGSHGGGGCACACACAGCACACAGGGR
jgi:hypothetical protein